MAEITIQNIHKSFGKGKAVLNGIDLTINANETIALLGSSGSGKTTLLKIINRLVEPDTGFLSIAGTDIFTQPAFELRRKLGYVIQNVGLLPHLTILENIRLVGRITKQVIGKAKIYELIKLVGLSEDLLNKYPAQLSGGQQQRIGIARALANDPDIILMDEPFSALDNITRTQLQDDFLNLSSLSNKTIVMVTHDIPEAFKLADRIALLNNGTLQQVAPPLELILNPANDFVRDFIKNDQLMLALQAGTYENRTFHDHLTDPTYSNDRKMTIAKFFFEQFKL